MRKLFPVCLVVFLVPINAIGQEKQSQKVRSRTINQRIAAQWTDATHFSFTEQQPDGTSSVRLVDAETGVITTKDQSLQTDSGRVLRGGPLPRSQPSSTETAVEFVNETADEVELFWIDPQKQTRSYGRISPGETRSQHTFAGHAWMVKGRDGEFYGSTVAQSPPTIARIKKTFDLPKSKGERDRRRPRRGSASKRSSADGQEFRIHEGQLQIRTAESGDQGWSTLDAGQFESGDWVSPSWSPDGSVLAAWRVIRNQPADAVTIESSPKGGGRAVVRNRPYKLPGDPSDEYQLVAFEASSGSPVDLDFPVIDFGRPRIRWIGDQHMVIEKVDRGHQRVRLFVVDPMERAVHAAVDESSDTFVWTMHGPQVPRFSYLEKTNEVIYSSEVSGYRHLYLVDLDDYCSAGDGQVPSPTQWQEQSITSGQWLVRRIVKVDESSRTVDVMAGEFDPSQDPYQQHLVRVGFDGSGLTRITSADGDHSIEYSPDGRFVVVTHSRVDSAPVHELRRTSDGELVTELMRAERVGASDSQWELPRVFHAKGRDGETEIWGNLYFPIDYDLTASSRYPVIEAIYAGPHDSHVPKRYLHSRRFNELNELGFVVVQIDGMGTANRSKAFHDECWHNLKDAGFLDRIAWMKAAGEEFPGLDLSRVGIFGTSAGGQNACGALLFHGDFYKAAYASCGCHDNRMDKASWNEQWMGYPVGEHYGANSNIDNAEKLQGDLFLVVGELDSNVPPESTYRLVNALVKANKDFDFLMVPGMGHSDGGTYGRRRMREFFVEKLQP